MNRSSGNLTNKWQLIKDEMALVDTRLQEFTDTASPEIFEVSSYIFNGAGKRMRPGLLLLAAYRPGRSLTEYIDAAVALELVHTASLLHDDVIDMASIRRGKDTVHVKWSNRISVLTGDYLLSRALEMLVSYHNWGLMDIIVKIVENMSEGEIEQAFANCDTAMLEERYFKWIGKKSAYFFAGCCQAGSHMREDSPRETSRWFDYGYNLGIAFQLVDDLLDYTGKKDQTGKPLYGDLSNRVITLPLIRALGDTQSNRLVNSLMYADKVTGEEISVVANAVLEGDGPGYTYRKAEEYINKAIAAVDKLSVPDNHHREVLIELARDILKRTR
ncbi:MAG: polyprenyl synthetase family protein [Bacillota bacterium]|nr:polyprenyl synthetase family protein [Bacillota bacterium]